MTSTHSVSKSRSRAHHKTQTPLSRHPGLYGSPGTSSFRLDDETLLIFAVGSRSLSAGIAGESAPRCNISYTPDLWRRIGDYRQYDPDYEGSKTAKAESWELWDLDVRRCDFGLVGDRVERVVSFVEERYLLLDNRARRVTLTVPSALPRPVLTVLLGRLFEVLNAVSVTVLPSSVMAAVGAGVRSALVVDLGWFETSVSAVFEYMEVRQTRSVRAGKMLHQEVRQMLEHSLKESGPHDGDLSFEEVEEVIQRVIWCKDMDSATREQSDDATPITIPLGTTQLSIPFSRLAEPVETALFESPWPPDKSDDHDLPLPQLLFRALLQLPIDIRNTCMSHIIFTGGLSHIPGLKSGLLSSLESLVKSQGWTPIRSYGTHLRMQKRTTADSITPRAGESALLTKPMDSQSPTTTRENSATTASTPTPKSGSPVPAAGPAESRSTSTAQEHTAPKRPAHDQPHDTDPISTKLESLTLQTGLPKPSPGSIRAIRSLGDWAGASLAADLRVRGVMEVERERFFSVGLVGGAVSGAAPGGVSAGRGLGLEGTARSRQSLGPGMASGRSGWSLSVWG